jgi:hypothetical protein
MICIRIRDQAGIHVAETTSTLPTSNLWIKLKALLIAVIMIILLLAFAVWSGIPGGERATIFWIGVAVLILILFGLGGLTWHLLIRPLPFGQRVEIQPIRASYRRATALLLGVGAGGIVVGAFWDEVWHRIYGIPFGDDLLWRPHLLMYFGFLSVTLLGFGGLYIISQQGKGTFQQRFRANPIIGLLILLGAFLMYVLPADPIWHEIYGDDITAWGIPHLLLVMNWVSMMLLAVGVHMTLVPAREWRGVRHLSAQDVFPIVIMAVMLLMWVQFFTTEWDARTSSALLRPEWLLPVLIVMSATFTGVIINHTLRRAGAATITGLVALAVRYALIQLFQVDFMHLDAWVLALPILLMIDLWAAYAIFQKREAWVGEGVAAGMGMGLVLVTIFNTYYDHVLITNLPVTLMVVLAASLGTSWAGAKIGDYFARSNKQVEETTARLPLMTIGALVVACLFVALFVTTASPPV